jgi:hypothetical protein
MIVLSVSIKNEIASFYIGQMKEIMSVRLQLPAGRKLSFSAPY